jgi:hypothetical protein
VRQVLCLEQGGRAEYIQYASKKLSPLQCGHLKIQSNKKYGTEVSKICSAPVPDTFQVQGKKTQVAKDFMNETMLICTKVNFWDLYWFM